MHSQSKRRAKIISDECVLCCQCSAHRTKCERKVDGENAREKKPSKTKLERLKGVDNVSGVDGVRYTRYSQANNVDKSLRNRVDVKCHAKRIASSTKRRKKKHAQKQWKNWTGTANEMSRKKRGLNFSLVFRLEWCQWRWRHARTARGTFYTI